MARVTLFTGTLRALPESGAPTGMFKTRVTRPLGLGTEGFEGDHQADRRVHGGPEKAVHIYPSGHYEKLVARFPDAALHLVSGAIGENISTPDLDESSVRIGDLWQLGTAQLQTCQPRNPCWKIDERFASEGMAAFIAEKLLTGWYFRVVKPGVVAPGDEMRLVDPAATSFTLHEAMMLWRQHRPDLSQLDRLAASPGIAPAWRDKIRQRLDYLKRS